MFSIRRTVKIALFIFMPVFGGGWLCAPWSTSRASFEISDMYVHKDLLPDALEAYGSPSSLPETDAWLQSDNAAKIVLQGYTRRHTTVLTEVGDAWDIKLRERARSLACLDELDAWRIRGRTTCSWLNDWIKNKTDVDRLDVIDDRLSITRSDGDARIGISFRAADRDLAIAVVDAYGEALLEHYREVQEDLRHQVVEAIETEFEAVTTRVQAREQQLRRQDPAVGENDDTDLDLLAKFFSALRLAREELPADQSLSRELNAVNNVARNELLGKMAGRISDSAGFNLNEGFDAEPSEIAPSVLSLLNHPVWSNPLIVQLSETRTSGLSTKLIAGLALCLSLFLGALLSLLWSVFERRGRQQDAFYASPYANPHWPIMRVANESH